MCTKIWTNVLLLLTSLAHLQLSLSAGLSQTALDRLAESLSIQAEVLDNLADPSFSHETRLTLGNNGNTPIPSSGWVLYFHSIYLLYPRVFPKNKSIDLDVEKIRVKMIHGDLYSLEPIPGFQEIQPNESRYYDIHVAVWSISRTDFAPNWYVTSTEANVTPQIVKSTVMLDYVKPFDDPVQWKRYNFDKYNPFSTQDRFNRLYVENTGKAEKLVIPTPKEITSNGQSTVTIDTATWQIQTGSKDAVAAANVLSVLTGIPVRSTSVSSKVIILTLDATLSLSAEGYTLNIRPDNVIELTGKDQPGLFYAVQSLKSIIDAHKNKDVPTVSIRDEPRFKYRGMFIDVARNFHTVDDLKRLMTAMSMFKLNKLHIHLCDDEGWRLEIPSLPELTATGSNRCHDLYERNCVIPQYGSGPYNNTSGTGFYTVAEYKELLNFANKHHIEVIPEFDMPGHAHAAIVSMEERHRKLMEAGNQNGAEQFRLKDPDDSSVYISVQQWTDNAVNPCMQSTYDFVEEILKAVIEMHKDIQPLKTYHFGGDEVANGAWEDSPRCTSLLTEHPQFNVSKGLKKYFAMQVALLTKKHGVGIRGWEDGFMDKDGQPLPLSDLGDPKASANPWDNIWEWGASQRAYLLANAGYEVVMSQATDLYFDHPYEPDPEERGFYWATRFTDTFKTFTFLPDSLYDNIEEKRSGETLTKADVCGADMSKCQALNKPENVIGMQGHLWSETIRTSENMDYMIFPRLLAVAERAWYKADFEEESLSAQDRPRLQKEEWKAFANTLGHKELSRLSDIGIQYRVPPPGAMVDNDMVTVSTTFPGLAVESSQDGGVTWSPVTGKPSWQQGKTMHLRTVSADGKRQSRVVQVFKEESIRWTDQHELDYMGANLKVHVTVVDNLQKDDNHMTMSMDLKNDGNRHIGPGTWKLYLYSLYGIRSEKLDCGLTSGHVNGGLFYFTPSDKTFPGIAAGETLTCTFYNRYWSIARTDQFPNLYVTSHGMVPIVIENTKFENLSYVQPFTTEKQWKRTSDDRFSPYTAAQRYEMYKLDDGLVPTGTVVPTPYDVTKDGSQTVTLSRGDGWKCVASTDFSFESKFLAEKLDIPMVQTVPGSKYIVFRLQSIEDNDPDAYKLEVNASSITITANAASGGLNAAQTLLALVETGSGNVPLITINDKPRFSYRGVMLDTARNFKPKAMVLRFLDLMSMYKLNRLHFHLTDDEAWRLEIPEIPELTEPGSRRCQTDYTDKCVIPQLGSGPDNTTSGSGYYTVAEYREILEYANDRHIVVIPEVDMPAHSTAAIRAMEARENRIKELKVHHVEPLPESFLLTDVDYRHSLSESPQKWKGNALNPCIESTFRFVDKMLDGIIALHAPVQPLKVFHMGGDEVPEGSWNESQACKNRPVGSPHTTNELQREFVRRVADIVARKQLNVAAWEDGMYADSRPNDISDFKSSDVYAYVWNSRWEPNSTAIRVSEFADAGYKVVMPLATHLYMDQPYEPDPEERGLYWASRNTETSKVFGFMPDDIFANADVDRFGNPVDLKQVCGRLPCPNPTKPENIIGLQGCLFSETVRTEEQLDYMLFPRLVALAERAWHKASWEDTSNVTLRDEQRKQDWDNFRRILGLNELPRLEKHGVKYRVAPPGAILDGANLLARPQYPGEEVEFSLDNGYTWARVLDGQRFLRPGSYDIQVRARSQYLKRPGREVTLPTGIVSGASSVVPYITLVFLISILFL